jgi:hypothetical protein
MILGQMTTAYPVSLPAAESWTFISAKGVLISIGIAVAGSILFSLFRARKQNIHGVQGWTEVILDAVFAPIIALVGFLIGMVVKVTGDKSFIAFGLLSIYFLGLNIEGYYLALGNGGSFMSIPFVNTNADISNLFNAINTDFWVFAGSCVFSVCVQAYQAWALRDVPPEVNKRRFEESAKHKVPAVPTDSLDITAVYHSRYKTSGKKMELNNMVGLSISWIIDIGVAIQKYPLFPFNSKWDGFGSFLLALLLVLITILGSEVAIAGYQKGCEENRIRNSGVARVPNP